MRLSYKLTAVLLVLALVVPAGFVYGYSTRDSSSYYSKKYSTSYSTGNSSYSTGNSSYSTGNSSYTAPTGSWSPDTTGDSSSNSETNYSSSYKYSGSTSYSTRYSTSSGYYSTGTRYIYRPSYDYIRPQPEPEPQPQPPASGLTATEQKMISLVNQEREKRGLQPLSVDMKLVQLAREKSQDMIDNNYFGHTSPTLGTPFQMLRSAGVLYIYAGENLAGAGTVASAHRNLMNSSGHRHNILNPKYTHIGIGIARGGPYGMMITQLFAGR